MSEPLDVQVGIEFGIFQEGDCGNDPPQDSGDYQPAKYPPSEHCFRCESDGERCSLCGFTADVHMGCDCD